MKKTNEMWSRDNEEKQTNKPLLSSFQNIKFEEQIQKSSVAVVVVSRSKVIEYSYTIPQNFAPVK